LAALTDWIFGVSIVVAGGMIVEIIKFIVREHPSQNNP
jgi:hypothetical protein